jgi:hypothetical protein
VSLPARWARRVTANWGLKLAALALALLLWVVVTAEQVTSQWMSIPLRVVLHDPRLRVSPRHATEARVRFSGRGRDLWDLAFRRPMLTLPVREMSETGLYSLEPEMVSVPGRIAVVAREVQPAWIRLAVSRRPVRRAGDPADSAADSVFAPAADTAAEGPQ